MVKHLHCLVFFLFFSVIFCASTTSAQSKKEKSSVKVAPAKNLTPVEMDKAGLQIAEPEKDPAKEKESSYTNFVVFANPNEGAHNLIPELSRYFPGIESYSLAASPQAQLLRSRAASIELIKRAFGGSLHIFSESDLEAYSQSVPFFAQLREEVMSITSKFSK